jgi:predicted PurR-regulated permease PerM
MENVFKSQKLKSLIPYLIIGIAIVIAHRVINELDFFLGVLNRIWIILSPFFFGFILAYIVSIPCNAVQRLLAKSHINWVIRKRKMLSIILVFLIIAVLISIVLNLIIPIIANSIAHLINYAHVYYDNVVGFIERINALEIPGLYISTAMAIEFLQNFMQSISPQDMSRPIDAFVGFGMSLFRGLLALISMVYILHEKEKFKTYISKAIKAILPTSVYCAIMRYVTKLNNNFKQYIYTQTIDGCILGTIATIALYAMGSPFFLILGLMLGILNYIPYFGSIFGSAIAVVVVAFTQGMTMGIISAIVLLIIQQIDANIIQPKLMSGPFSLSPFLVIVSITVGGAIAGVFGMIAAIPIVSVLRDIFENIVSYFERQKAAKEGEAASAQPDDSEKKTEKEAISEQPDDSEKKAEKEVASE